MVVLRTQVSCSAQKGLRLRIGVLHQGAAQSLSVLGSEALLFGDLSGVGDSSHVSLRGRLHSLSRNYLPSIISGSELLWLSAVRACLLNGIGSFAIGLEAYKVSMDVAFFLLTSIALGSALILLMAYNDVRVDVSTTTQISLERLRSWSCLIRSHELVQMVVMVSV